MTNSELLDRTDNVLDVLYGKKVGDKDRKKLTGYMLWSGRGQPKVGEQWWPVASTVWICKTKNDAEKIRATNPIWHEVCKVQGRVNCWTENGLFYTNESNRLHVVEFYPMPMHLDEVSEEQVIKNAKAIIGSFTALMNQAFNSNTWGSK